MIFQLASFYSQYFLGLFPYSLTCLLFFTLSSSAYFTDKTQVVSVFWNLVGMIKEEAVLFTCVVSLL